MRLYYFLYFLESGRYLVADDFDWSLESYFAKETTYYELHWDHRPHAIRAYEAIVRQAQANGIPVPKMSLRLKSAQTPAVHSEIQLPIRKTSSKKKTVELTVVEIQHILQLMGENAREGTYYGPKNQYWCRHHRIVDKLEGA